MTASFGQFLWPKQPIRPERGGVWSSLGKLGHLLWDEAVLYRQLFDEIRRRGYDGGFCEAVMRGGTPDKPNIGTGFEVGLALFMAFLTIGTCRVDRRRPQPTLPLGERRLDQLASLLGRLQVEAAAGA